ncbi:hypothetical protein K0M31_011108 [Melipona bicolor]|uniref:Uncharacterized protein n=1 Tax=Melipona bicolor TaxID=60889 RepID=A0AA40G947_9HYME|nr:hypothetical protein K0M31_011108 [Melipona bicolor]
MLESMDVADTAYNCEWYSLPPKDARLLIIIMCRARASPLKLTAGKFCWFNVLLYSQVSKNELHDIWIQFSVKSSFHSHENRHLENLVINYSSSGLSDFNL